MGSDDDRYAVFASHQIIGRGRLAEVARAAHAARDQTLLILKDDTGQQVELDLRGSAEEVLARLAPAPTAQRPARGRPKLGVIAREVTLLPRHWDWLAAQPGGASAALRRLVDQARRDGGEAQDVRRTQETVYRVMTTLAGNLPGYEEVTRALFAGDRARFDELTRPWPKDIGDYVRELNGRADAPSS